MKAFTEKILVLCVPFLLIISICYNNGYWSLFPINIYDYYQVTDILKAIALPSFGFLSLLFLPLLILGIVLIPSRNDLSTQETDAEGKKTTSKSNVFDHITPAWLRLLVRGVLTVILPCYLIYFIFIVSAIISPYFGDKEFLSMYYSSIPDILQRAIFSIIAFPLLLCLSLLYINTVTTQKIPIFKITISSICILSTCILAYHSGRLDAYKIISGYEFLYSIDNRGGAHKYLGKLDKFFFFSDDNRIISPKGSMNMQIDTITYSSAISIVSEDSMKYVRLAEYSTFHASQSEKQFIGKFLIRNPVTVKKR